MRKTLAAWYSREKRDLPWRRRHDAYGIWLSEVMLQQTRVSTVIPYYQRFLQRFPDVFALAAAPLDDVLTAWSGLGYYRRARLLHAGAVHVAESLGGVFPPEPAALQAIPGIGAYTAGAIASIAFGTRAPVVDGNVERVLCRVVADPLDPRRAGKRALWQRAADLVDPAAPGDFNQALMELGATVCTPKNPACDECPWRRDCAAAAQGTQLDYPRLGARITQKPLELTYLVLRAREEGTVLVGKRPAEGRFAGMWEPPCIEGGSAATRVTSLCRALGVRRGKSAGDNIARECGGFEHVLSHLRLAVSVYSATIPNERTIEGLFDYVETAWRPPHAERGESRLARRALELTSVLG